MSLEDYWKDDFVPLQAAGREILQQLRNDESAADADLYRRLSTGQHLYFDTVNNSLDQVQLQHVQSEPLPPLLSQALAGVKAHSFMGLLAPIHMAWMSVDETLYLWPYGHASGFWTYQVPSGQAIMSVGLVPPTAGVFKPSVQYCLVITTPDEVTLCALARLEGGNELQLIPTVFRLSTDQVRMLAIAGTHNGRIFLGGQDGCLYEMVYQLKNNETTTTPSIQQQLDAFYEETKVLPAVVPVAPSTSLASNLWHVGKRTWRSLSNAQQAQDGPPLKKCRKLNRSNSRLASIATAVLPDFVWNFATTGSFTNKHATGGGSITKMVIDEDRQALYTLSANGTICSLDLNTNAMCATFHATKTVRLYLEAVARGQMLPPSSSIRFPGGGIAAQAGVGGMEGARAILKAADWSSGGGGPSTTRYAILQPVALHVLPPSESKRLTLLAVTAGGLRLYLSSLAPNILNSGPNTVPSNLRPLAPSTTLTLCHVRSPPPIHDKQQLEVDTGIVGGMKPKYTDTTRVEVSLYDHGVWMAALETKRKTPTAPISTSSTNSRQSVGNVILATCPDAVARKVESMDATTTTTTASSDRNRVVYSVSGGVAETWSMPMAAAETPDGILPGGLLWEIASIEEIESPVRTLTIYSQTPTDSELAVGLPPAFFPPSKLRSRQVARLAAMNGNAGGSQSDALVPQSPSLSVKALQVFGDALTRSIWRSLWPVDSWSQAHIDHAMFASEYRISQRTGSKGYSRTAAETSRYDSSTTYTSQRTAKSARLRPWLIQPPPIPLNNLSTQHLDQTRRMVAVNAGGLHYFALNSILSNFADAIMAAGENVAHDPTVTSFFVGYSYKEGCAMSLALAVGCGPADTTAALSEQLRERAKIAALSRAFVPKLVALIEPQNGQGGVHTVTNSPEILVPPGYEFQSSELYKGLTLLVTRLLRPIWNKAPVVVTEGRVLTFPCGSKVSPAKVELLLNDASLEAVRRPLRDLMVLMRTMFFRAVASVPGVTQRTDSEMDIDDEEGTRALAWTTQYASGLRTMNGVMPGALTQADAERRAQLIEEKNVHAIYRLVSRTVQILNTISLLLRAQAVPELNETEWGLLHGLTVSQFVLTSDGQDRLETLLNCLVTSSVGQSYGHHSLSAEADILADQFSKQCYHFFSPGSRSAYLGLRNAKEALASPMGSSRRSRLLVVAANHFRNAAEHWVSAPLITGRILHTRGAESFEQIALRAMQFGSPLALAVDALIRLKDVGTAVDVCLITAANFVEKAPGRSQLPQSLGDPTYTFGWEQNLYHRRRDTEPAVVGAGSPKPPSPSSTNQIVAFGASVSSKDAIDTCYALVFHHLSILLRTDRELADRMVSACSAAPDKRFLNEFFRFMVDENYSDTMLRIDSKELEIWLRERSDQESLWRYYNVQGKHAEAAEICWTRANDRDSLLSLDDRIDWLLRAQNSYSAAARPSSDAPARRFTEKATEMGTYLDIARIQRRILRTVEGSHSDTEEVKDKIERLKSAIIPVTELFNDFAAALNYYEYCLYLLHVCRKEDDSIRPLWKNLVCKEILPCATRKAFTYSYLQKFLAELSLGDGVTLLRDSDPGDGYRLFDNGDWAKPLASRIVAMGRELYGTGADYVFPVDYLFSALEDLRRASDGSVQRMWPLLTLSDAGVPFLVVLDLFRRFAAEEDRFENDPNHRLEHVLTIVDFLMYWVEAARRSRFAHGTTDNADEQLMLAISSGQLFAMIDELKTQVQTMSTSSQLLRRIHDIEQAVRLL